MTTFTKKWILIAVLFLPNIVIAQFQIGIGAEAMAYGSDKPSVGASGYQFLSGYYFNKHLGSEFSFSRGSTELESGFVNAYTLSAKYAFATSKKDSKFYFLLGYTAIDANYKSAYKPKDNGFFGLGATPSVTVVGDTSTHSGYHIGIGTNLNIVPRFGFYFKLKLTYRNDINLFDHFDTKMLNQFDIGIHYNFIKKEKPKTITH